MRGASRTASRRRPARSRTPPRSSSDLTRHVVDHLRPGPQPVGTAGKLFAFGLDVGKGLFKRPFQWREFLQQAWFIASVTIIPTALVAIPFGAVIALQVGGLIKQFGAQSFTGSASVLAVVREAGPIATSLLIAGAGGSAIAADLGARKIREELDAMMVLGIDPIQRLVVPRVLACMLVAVFLNGLVSVVGVMGGYVFNVRAPGRHSRVPTSRASPRWRSCPTSGRAWPRR